MCQGNQRSSFSCEEGDSTPQTTSDSVDCELCGSRASLYCQADDAFLCRKCDLWVHGANFLARRHIRCLICNKCQNLTQRYLIGASAEVVLPTIVSLKEERHCISELEENKSSRMLKTPFLLL
ncbi:B-box domain protein 30-like [Tripterygium wilfordii]|nr:B-box domain protein 30-like [Tripterygium wilfordii]